MNGPYLPHLMDAAHARRFISPGRLAVYAIEKERAGKPEQAALLLDAAAALVRGSARPGELS